MEYRRVVSELQSPHWVTGERAYRTRVHIRSYPKEDADQPHRIKDKPLVRR